MLVETLLRLLCLAQQGHLLNISAAILKVIIELWGVAGVGLEPTTDGL
jgi:hypothetical protein